jgi:hypothetical protein
MRNLLLCNRAKKSPSYCNVGDFICQPGVDMKMEIYLILQGKFLFWGTGERSEQSGAGEPVPNPGGALRKKLLFSEFFIYAASAPLQSSSLRI